MGADPDEKLLVKVTVSMYQLFLIFYRKTKVKDEFYRTKIRQDPELFLGGITA